MEDEDFPEFTTLKKHFQVKTHLEKYKKEYLTKLRKAYIIKNETGGTKLESVNPKVLKKAVNFE